MAKTLKVIALTFALAFLVSCSQPQDVSSGQIDQVAGFLFVSDNRSNTTALVEAIDAGDIPVRATYDFGQETTLTDPEDIRKLYSEMSNLVLVGQTPLNTDAEQYYVEFELQDGTICRFDFHGKSYMIIGDQYYSIESGGNFYDIVVPKA